MPSFKREWGVDVKTDFLMGGGLVGETATTLFPCKPGEFFPPWALVVFWSL